MARWTKEDLKDQDRLFLLGEVLRFNEDPRSEEILEAAFKMTGSGDHLIALLAPPIRMRRIELTAQLRACDAPGEPVPFSDLSQGAIADRIHGSETPPKVELANCLQPGLSPEPPDEPKMPQLQRQPVDLPSPR